MACSIPMAALEVRQEHEQEQEQYQHQHQQTNPTLIENEDSQLVISKSQFCSHGNMEETEEPAVHLDVNGPGVDCPEDEDGKRNPERHKTKKVTFVTVRQVENAMDRDLEKGLGGLDTKEGGEAAHSVGEAADSVGDDAETVCRVCHLSSDSRSSSGDLINIGCGCKEDLGIAHRQCAEAWFKIRGNRSCEICGETAMNVVGVGDAVFLEEWNDRDAENSGESPRCWRSRPLCNFLMACMVVAFILPWFFRVSMF